jgi:hypothetical protein
MTGEANFSEQDPRDPEEWQFAVDGARVMLLVDSAKSYGLIEGPPVRVERCLELIERGAEIGIVPRDDDTILREFFSATTSMPPRIASEVSRDTLGRFGQ